MPEVVPEGFIPKVQPKPGNFAGEAWVLHRASPDVPACGHLLKPERRLRGCARSQQLFSLLTVCSRSLFCSAA